jgi:curved DNA-binding protein CbpA
MAGFVDYYRILQVSPLAEPEAISAAYKKLAQQYHPDVNTRIKSTERMKRINSAYDVLGNTEKRKIYHARWLKKRGAAYNMIFAGRAAVPLSGTAPAKKDPVKSVINYLERNIRLVEIALIALSILIMLAFSIIGIPTAVNNYRIAGKWKHGKPAESASPGPGRRPLDTLRGLPADRLCYLEFDNRGNAVLIEDGFSKSGIYTIAWIDNLNIRWDASNETAGLKFSGDGNKLYLLFEGCAEEVFQRHP